MPITKNTKRLLVSNIFKGFSCMLCLGVVALLAVLLWHLAKTGGHFISAQFLQSFPSRKPELAGVWPALIGTLYVVGGALIVSIPLGLLTALFLSEYLKRGAWFLWLKVNISNLAGIPGVVYGLLGLAVFVRWGALGESIAAGALTLSLLSLPIVVIASLQALENVDPALKTAAYALGAKTHQVIGSHTLPAALPGILSGLILAFSRILGEASPLLIVGAATYISFLPEHWTDPFSAMPVQIFNWAMRPEEDFRSLSAAASLVLIAILLSLNLVAALFRYIYSNKK